jgi:hypothetical protein
MPAPQEVQAILDRSCMDCHSHATRWPWYAHVAPVSWLVAYDVRHARGHMNLSKWNGYPPKRQIKKVQAIWDEVEDGEMPLAQYLLMHPEAKLSDADKATLKAWSEARAKELEAAAAS